MSKNMNLGVIGIFILLFLTASSYALSENFEVDPTIPNVISCTHTITTDSIVVKNTGDVESTYSISSSGTTDFAAYSDSAFSLKPGESKAIFVYLNPDEKGDYTLETKIRTVFGLEKTVSQKITTKSCSNIQLQVNNPSLKSNPCQPSTFSFTVTNTGDFTESYEFGVKGLEGYATLSTTSALIQPKQSLQVDLFVNPECGTYGQKELKFQALAQTNQYLAEADVVLDIARSYDYSVIIPGTINICNLKPVAIPVSIANNAPFTNQYDISVKGPSWLSQEAERVELGPQRAGTTNIIASPSNPGSFIMDVAVNSLRGDIIKEGNFNISVEKCYSPSINIVNPSDIIVAGHSAQYKIDIKNEGTHPDTYSFEMDAPEWVTGNVQKTTLNKGESKSFTLTAIPNETGNYAVTLRIISNETQTYKDDILKLKVIAPEEAYTLDISPEKTRILYGQEVINVDLKNKGVLPGTYDLVLNGPKFMTLLTKSVTLKAGETGIAQIQTDTKDSDEQANYEAQIIANVKGESVGFSSKFIVKLRQLTAWQEIYAFVMNNLIVVISIVAVLVTTLFIAIFGRKIARSWRNWRLRRKELAKIKAEIKQRAKEAKLARKLMEKSLKRSSGFGKKLFGSFMIILSLLIIVAGVISLTGYAPVVAELFKAKQQNLFEPMIKVDTAGLEAYGNTVIIRGEKTLIPIIVNNNYNDTLTFDVKTEQSWIITDTNEVELDPGKQEIVTIIVTPDETQTGMYTIKISASLQKNNKLLSEDINLNIKNRSIIQDALGYVWYILGGLVVLIIGIIFTRKRKPAKVDESIAFSPAKYKPLRKIEVSLPKKK